jgi:hypothetical protein
MEFEQLHCSEQQMHRLEQEIAQLLQVHSAAVERLTEVPDLGVESASQSLLVLKLLQEPQRQLQFTRRDTERSQFIPIFAFHRYVSDNQASILL